MSSFTLGAGSHGSRYGRGSGGPMNWNPKRWKRCPLCGARRRKQERELLHAFWCRWSSMRGDGWAAAQVRNPSSGYAVIYRNGERVEDYIGYG
jgi:hypothetical protein